MSQLADIFEEARSRQWPLAQRLEHYAAGLRACEPGLAEAYEAFIADIAKCAAGHGAPRIGDELPGFVLPDGEGGLVSSDRLLGRGPLVVSINRGHWCSFCKLELSSLAAIDAELKQAEASLVAVTPERPQLSRQLKSDTALGWPMLTDLDLGVALSLGLVVPVGESLQHILANAGVDLPRFHGTGHWFLPIPATFVVAPDGRIVARFVDPDFRRRMEPAAILAALGAVGHPTGLSTAP